MVFFKSKRGLFLLGSVLFVLICFFCYKRDSGDIVVDNDLLCVSKKDLGPFDDEKVLYIYNWVEYIPNEVVYAFEKITGIKVYVDVFESNEMLEIKLISGKSKYDLVCPSLTPFMGRQLQIGIYQKLDKSLLKTLPELDPFIMGKVSEVDKNAEYCLPYLWGIVGYAVNLEKLSKIAQDVEVGSWDLLFNEEHLKKISKGNVSFSNSAAEIFSTLAHYMFGEELLQDDQLKKVAERLASLRKYIYKFNSQSMNDLFNGSSVVAFGTSADIRQMMLDSKKDGIKSNIKFFFPKEGGLLWIDVLAIPKGAKHFKNAHAFLKFIYHPRIMAEISNFTASANPVLSSKGYVMPEIVNDEIIYPTKEMLRKTYLEKIGTSRYTKIRTKMFMKIKAGI